MPRQGKPHSYEGGRPGGSKQAGYNLGLSWFPELCPQNRQAGNSSSCRRLPALLSRKASCHRAPPPRPTLLGPTPRASGSVQRTAKAAQGWHLLPSEQLRGWQGFHFRVRPEASVDREDPLQPGRREPSPAFRFHWSSSGGQVLLVGWSHLRPVSGTF